MAAPTRVPSRSRRYFQSQFGTLNGLPQFNLITEAQKDRVREVFEYYGYYLGVQFVETAAEGFTIAVGDPRSD